MPLAELIRRLLILVCWSILGFFRVDSLHGLPDSPPDGPEQLRSWAVANPAHEPFAKNRA
jgi:hypothetical protein